MRSLMKDLSKRKILNIAWMAHGDFGDEVMGFVLRSYLKKYGCSSITYYQKGYADRYVGKDDIEMSFIHPHGRIRILRNIIDRLKLRAFNAVIVGGGSILHSAKSIQWKQEIVKRVCKGNKNFFVGLLGVSLGPFKGREDKRVCADFLNITHVNIFRDDYSAKLAKDISNNSNNHASLDSSLLLPKLFPQEFSPQNFKKDSNVVGIMFVRNNTHLDEFNKEHRLERFVDIVNHITKQGKVVKLISLYTGSAYSDNELIREIEKSVDMPKLVYSHIFSGDIFETMREIGECGDVISMRLHGIIFAYLLQIPFLSLEYDPKNSNFCQTVQYSTKMCLQSKDLLAEDRVESLISNLFDQGDVYIKEAMSVTEAAKLVEDNFKIFIHKLARAL